MKKKQPKIVQIVFQPLTGSIYLLSDEGIVFANIGDSEGWKRLVLPPSMTK